MELIKCTVSPKSVIEVEKVTSVVYTWSDYNSTFSLVKSGTAIRVSRLTSFGIPYIAQISSDIVVALELQIKVRY